MTAQASGQPMFGGRHYNAIVYLLATEAADPRYTVGATEAMIRFTELFAKDNPRFDAEKFLQAFNLIRDRTVL